MPNLLLKLMASYTMTAEAVTLGVREYIGSEASLHVAYEAEHGESNWMREQLECGCRLFNIVIDCEDLARRYHQMLLIHLNSL